MTRIGRIAVPGLRRRLAIIFAVGSLAVSAVLGVSTFVLARTYLLEQRERSALRVAFADAAVVRDGLATRGRPLGDVIGSLNPPSGTEVFVHTANAWFSSSLPSGEDHIPLEVRQAVHGHQVAVAWTSVDGASAVAVGVPLAASGAQFYQVSQTGEVQTTLVTLRRILTGVSLATAILAAALGAWAASRVTRPLQQVASAAGRIAAGDLGTRLEPTDDPTLAPIVGSFNAMVETLNERIERDARFAADVSHELRTPLTALVTSVQVLQGRKGELSERSAALLMVVAEQLDRFQRLLQDLLDLAQLDSASASARDHVDVDIGRVVDHTLAETGRGGAVEEAAGQQIVHGDPRLLRRAVANLLDNADLHGGGLRRVGLGRTGQWIVLQVDDSGPGVPIEDRSRIFDRFARGGAAAAKPGSGLGLSLVADIAAAHGGTVRCTSSPGGGARFELRLPAAADPLAKETVITDAAVGAEGSAAS